MSNNAAFALITGACGGIGSALVEVFNESGYRVIGTDRQRKDLVTSAAEFYLQLDLAQLAGSAAYTEAACTEILELTQGSGISALINNAAVQNLGKLDEISRESWSETISVNLSAPLFLIQGLAASLTENNGSVVNVSSIHATQTKPGFLAYATSKGALSAMTRNLAVSLGDKVRINAIEPAAVGTPMLKEGFKNQAEKLELLNSYHPLGRIAAPEEVAELALFLCSEKASFIHGECISISGGICSRLHDPE